MTICSANWQGGIVTAMTINYGVLLGFVPSDEAEVGKYTEAVSCRFSDIPYFFVRTLIL